MTLIFQELPIRSLSSVASDIFLLDFLAPALASQAWPGQFVMIRPFQAQDPLLPRPFSIHRLQGDRIAILFKVVGSGTRRLAGLKRGDLLEVRGPLGKGFQFRPEDDLVLAAGGMGVAPLVFAAEVWKRFPSKNKGSLKVFLGARRRDDLLCLKDFEKAGAEVFTATDDGSAGEKGPITLWLKKKIAKGSPRLRLLACGPTAMLRTIQQWAIKENISCQLSLETRMACGLGACLGCVTAREKAGAITYVNVCQEGPVFDAQEVVWDDPKPRA